MFKRKRPMREFHDFETRGRRYGGHHRHDGQHAALFGGRGDPGGMGGGRGRHGFGGGRGGFGGRGGGRVFGQGGLRLVLLKLIAEKPSHGYELIKEIEDRLGGAYSPSPGVVYPTLTMLEEQGYITRTQEDGSRKLYAVTPEGTALLAENQDQVDALFARIAEPGQRHGRRSPQIMRAIQNLRMAIDLRLGQGDVTEDQVNAIAAALDTAAQAVERA